MPRKPATLKIISRQSNLRHYTYKVRLSAATGKVMHIRAGCRTWKTFQAANEHYNPPAALGPTARWSDLWVNGGRVIRDDESWRLYAERREARAILHLLEQQVCDYQAAKRCAKAKARAQAKSRRRAG